MEGFLPFTGKSYNVFEKHISGFSFFNVQPGIDQHAGIFGG